MKCEIRDVAVVGAGPVGLFAVFAFGQLGMRCHVIDHLTEIGGQCAALYPEKPIYDIPGFPRILASDLVDNLAHQALPYEPAYHLGELAQDVTETEEGIDLRLSSGRAIRSKVVVLAGGAGAFGPNRPPLPHIRDLEGRQVHYWIKDKSVFRDQRVVIAGGGDSAVDWALSLVGTAKAVTLVHRRQRFRASPASLDQLKEHVSSGHISLKIPFQLHRLELEEGVLKGIALTDLDGTEEVVSADHLLPFFGISADISALSAFAVLIEDSRVVVEPSTMQTTRPNVYAVGDLASYANKQKLIATGFAEAFMAARSAYDVVYPEKTFHFEYSTTRGYPGVA